MKREFLKELGLTDEQIEKVMGENGKDVAAEVTKAKEMTIQVEDLKKQISQRDNDLADLKKQTGSNAELQKQFEELQSKYESETKNLNQQLADQRMDAALDAAIHSAKGRNGKAIKALLDRSKLKLRDDGTLEGLDLEAIKASDAYLFEIETQKDEGSNPTSGSAMGGTTITQDQFNQNIKNVAWMQANMDAVTKGLADGTLKKG